MSKHAEYLKNSFANHSAKVAVIGMGYVGFPMAQLAASKGFSVVGIEINQKRVDQINSGVSYIQDVASEDIKPFVQAGTLRGSIDYDDLKDVDAVMIAVPTPLGKTGDPDMSFVVNTLESLKSRLHKGMIIILESTTYPGTTEELFASVIQEAGFTVGEEIFVAFSPERIDPGNPIYGPHNTPKVVGGITPLGTEVATAFYQEIIERVVPVSSTVAAEVVKLYENTFRAINIGLANEMALICDLLEIDVWEIVDAASTKPFGFMPFYPGPGLGGHCIPIDPSYLAWKMRTLKYKTRFIDLATEININMPLWVISRVSELLNDISKSIRGSKILILGLAYKNDIDDLRESPALDVFELLQQRGAEVCYHDPYCPEARINEEIVPSKNLSPELLKDQDLVIITTGHKNNVDYQLVTDNADLIFDTRNTLRNLSQDSKAKIIFL